MISPGITISNHRLRWVVDGMRFTAPPHLMTIPVRKKFYICSDVSHTHSQEEHLAVLENDGPCVLERGVHCT